MTTPQQNAQNARLEQIKRSWQQKRQIGERLGKIRTKIGVYSGKGGVGKTTVAVNLAVTLAQEGARVGILDVDIDCPNVTNVLAATTRPDYVDGQIIPAEAVGCQSGVDGLLPGKPGRGHHLARPDDSQRHQPVPPDHGMG